LVVTETAPLPTAVGACSTTAIKSIATRLEGAPNSGSAVNFVNGYQVSYDYDTIPASGTRAAAIE
jgi:hypothetical protein